MGLGALTDEIAPERVVGIPVGEVTSLAYDSRRVGTGDAVLCGAGGPRRRPRLCRGCGRSGRGRRGRRARAARHRGPAAGRRPHASRAGRCRRRLVRATVEAADRHRRHRDRREIHGDGPDRRDAVGLSMASRPDRDRLHGHRSGARTEPAAHDHARGARAPGAPRDDGGGGERLGRHGGDVARARAGTDPELPLRRRRAHHGHERAPRVPRQPSRRIGRPRRAWSRRRRWRCSTPTTRRSATSGSGPGTGC